MHLPVTPGLSRGLGTEPGCCPQSEGATLPAMCTQVSAQTREARGVAVLLGAQACGLAEGGRRKHEEPQKP